MPQCFDELKAVLMLALPKIPPIRSDTPRTYGMLVKVFRSLPFFYLFTVDSLGGSQVFL